MRREVAGSPEVQSTSSAPRARPASSPSAPSSTVATSADTGKQVIDDVGAARRVGRRGGVARAGRLGEGARALGRAVPDGERDVGSGGEACGHRPADGAESEEGDGSHARKLIFPACARAFTSAE